MFDPPAPRAGPRRWRLAKAAAIACIGAAAIVALFLVVPQVLQPHEDPFLDTVSMLALGRGGFLVTAALVLAGLALVGIAVNFWLTVARNRLARAGALGLAFGGAQIFLLAFFPTDATVIPETAVGIAHWALSGIGLTVLPASMIALSWQFGGHTPWRMHLPVRWVSVLGMVASIAYGVLSNLHGRSGLPGPFYDGLAERVLVFFILAWGVLASLAIWRLAHVAALNSRASS